MAFTGKIAQAHNNKTKSFNLYRKFKLYETQNTKKLPKPKTVKTADYNCAYLTLMAVLIIFPVILQTVINLIMLSISASIFIIR